MSKAPKYKSASGPRVKLFVLFLGLLLVVALIGAGYFFNLYRGTRLELDSLRQNPQVHATEEVKNLITRVSELVQLPTDEEPTVATVTDIEKLREQPFFSNATNGDKVLIYAQARKAILYRPSMHKVIEVAPVTLGERQELEVGEETRLAVYNGTDQVGLSSTTGESIRSALSEVLFAEEIAIANAAGLYEATIVVDLSGTRSNLATAIAEVVEGSVGEFPAGEEVPDADILVILGDVQGEVSEDLLDEAVE